MIFSGLAALLRDFFAPSVSIFADLVLRRREPASKAILGGAGWILLREVAPGSAPRDEAVASFRFRCGQG